MGRCQPPGITTHDFLITKNGELFVRGLADCVLEGAVFPIFGHFKTRQEAKSLIESGGDAVIPYKLDASSRVVLKPKRVSTLPQPLQQFNNTPATLDSIFNAKTLGGLPQASLHLHSCENQSSGTIVTWKIQALDVACLKISIEEPTDSATRFPPAEIPFNKMSTYVNLAQVKLVEVLFALEYDSGANTLKGMLPQACIKVQAKLNKDVIAEL